MTEVEYFLNCSRERYCGTSPDVSLPVWSCNRHDRASAAPHALSAQISQLRLVPGADRFELFAQAFIRRFSMQWMGRVFAVIETLGNV
jgi:hypothetical protein